jgi:hypothetical protein
VPLFDSYVIVDWSANSKPKAGNDSIWIGVADRDPAAEIGLHIQTRNVRTRHAAEQEVAAALTARLNQRRRVLVGFDFPYGYPAGFANRLGGTSGKPWLATWEMLAREIRDSELNANNRFHVAAQLNEALGFTSGPFWGCPKSKAAPHLSPKGPDREAITLQRLRHVERAVDGVQEIWKLFTVGSVGSQALMGIPRVHSLRNNRDLAAVSSVWPFETGFTREPTRGGGPAIVHTEIWPGLVSLPELGARVKDDVQVETLARHFARLDSAGELAELFDTPRIDPDAVQECVDEEGWILGAVVASPIMKKPTKRSVSTLSKGKATDPDMRAEYDFARMTGGVRGKYAGRLTVADMRREYDFDYSKARPNPHAARLKGDVVMVVLAPDVAPFFPTSESVNAVLRAAIKAAQRTAVAIQKRSQRRSST